MYEGAFLMGKARMKIRSGEKNKSLSLAVS
jgi:hypothetical protein